MADWRNEFGAFVDQIRDDLGAVLRTEGRRFPSQGVFLQRFDEAAERLLAHGPDYLRNFEEVHNELCVATLLLEDSGSNPCVRLEYEPSLTTCDKRFDFKATFEIRSTAWVEVKTIHPDPIDSWEQYERFQRQGRFPERAELFLDKSWLGGPLFHKYFATRAKLLSYTIETEAKIRQCLTGPEKSRVFLVFFSNGFDWHVDHLEDFLHFYRHGVHFEGDHFRLMEEHYIRTNRLQLLRNIQHIGYMERRFTAVRPSRGSWDVEPVKWSPIRGFE